MSKYTYAVEVATGFEDDDWYALVKGEQRGFALGYLLGCRDSRLPPTRAHRMIRSDGKIIESYPANREVSIGMIAGFPSPEQYEAAARDALDKAERIRKVMNKHSKGADDGE